ncbi:MAG: pyrroline-5-carboxylate reductase [Thermodesulfovibrionales bacterium]|nr:pyrroline-5-carboxylate reductase [Thermodesulfovibrionales bacterium]
MTGFIGGGNMAEALIKGMVSHGMRDIMVSEPREERRDYLKKTYGVKTSASNLDTVKSCRIIILAVKPQQMAAVLDEIKDYVTEDKAVVSIAAGITLSFLQSRLSTKKIVRVMPNVCALAGEGMSVISLCECFSDKDIGIIRDIFMSVGKVLTLPERQIDAVTALSGSGPAFIALFLEAMIEAGVRLGLREDDAFSLASQTLLGTAALIDGGMPPRRLREMVTSPGGTTAEGLKVFNEKGLGAIVAEAMEAAEKRARELAK